MDTLRLEFIACHVQLVVKDMGWRHQAAPHVDEMCRVCYDLMEAEGIYHVQWSQHVKDEWQASGSTPCGRDVSCVP